MPAMADDETEQFSFIAKVMPPRPARDHEFPPHPSVRPLETFTVPANPTQTFSDLWEEIRIRFANYDLKYTNRSHFHKLQNGDGADFDLRDTPGKLGITGRSPKDQLQLIMLQNLNDQPDTIPAGSHLRPAGFKRPQPIEEEEEEEEEFTRRRKLQKDTYGAPVEDIYANTPVTSREKEDGQAVSSNKDEQPEPKMDGDGFVILRKLEKPAKRMAIPSSAESQREGVVMVEDSQVAKVSQNSKQPATSYSFQKPGSQPCQRNTGSQPSQKARKAPLPSQQTFGRQEGRTPATSCLAPIKASIARDNEPATKKKGLPMLLPNKVPSSRETPESAQRPKPTPATQQPPPPAQNADIQIDPTVDDPIDDDLLGDIDDLDFSIDEDEIERLPSAGRSQSMDITNQPSTQPSQLQISSTTNPFERLASSQVAPSLRTKVSTPSKKWTPVEDSAIIEGIKRGWGAAVIREHFNLQHRSRSAVRNRFNLLVKKHPKPKHPNPVGQRSSNQAGPASSATSTTRQVQKWSSNELTKLRRAIAEGLEDNDIQNTCFRNRSQDSIQHRRRKVEETVFRIQKELPDWPQDLEGIQPWSSRDKIRLRRAFRQAMPLEEFTQQWVGSRSEEEYGRVFRAYHKQMAKLDEQPGDYAKKQLAGTITAVSSPMEHDSSSHDSQATPAITKPTQPESSSREESTPSTIPSSPPQAPAAPSETVTEMLAQRKPSPEVVITSTEQIAVKEVKSSSQLTHTTPSHNQSTVGNGKEPIGGRRSHLFEGLDKQFERLKKTGSPSQQPTEASSVKEASPASSGESANSDGNDDNGEDDGDHDDGRNGRGIAADLQASGNDSGEVLQSNKAAIAAQADVDMVDVEEFSHERHSSPRRVLPQRQQRAAVTTTGDTRPDTQLAAELRHNLPRTAVQTNPVSVVVPPTDPSLYERRTLAEKTQLAMAVLNAKSKDSIAVKEFVEDLTISELRQYAMAKDDWKELKSLRAHEKYQRRERKIAKGLPVKQGRGHLHPDGPAQDGDDESADEDVCRQDDDSSESDDTDSEDDGGDLSAHESDSDSFAGDVAKPPITDREVVEIEDVDMVDESTADTKQSSPPIKRESSPVQLSSSIGQKVSSVQPSSPIKRESSPVQGASSKILQPPLPTPAPTSHANVQEAEEPREENKQERNKRKRAQRKENARKRRQSGGERRSSNFDATAITTSTTTTTTTDPVPASSPPPLQQQPQAREILTPSSAAKHVAHWRFLMQNADIPRPGWH